MLTIGQERPRPIEIDANSMAWTLMFSANGECLMSGHSLGLKCGKSRMGNEWPESMVCNFVSNGDC